MGQAPDWFKMNPAKFLSDAQVDAMSTLEFGACLRLLFRQHLDGHIPDNLHLLARHCRLEAATMAEVWVTLQNFFPEVEPGKRANRYMWIEREKVIRELERKSDEGTRAARKRWDEVKRKRDAAPSGSPSGSPMPQPMQEQSREEQSREENPPSKPKDGFDREAAGIVKEVFAYYLDRIGRHPGLYTLTDKRKRMGIARVRDLWPRAEDPKREHVLALMKLCVDRLKASKFHNGENDRGKKYLDWDILFRSTEQMEKWLSDEGVRQ